MCLDPFRVVLILGRFLGVEALIFTVATTQMQVRLPVPQAGGGFFFHRLSQNHENGSRARSHLRRRQYTINIYPYFRFDLANKFSLICVCYARTNTFLTDMVCMDSALLSRLLLRWPAYLFQREQWIFVHHCLAVAHYDIGSFSSRLTWTLWASDQASSVLALKDMLKDC